MKKEHTVKSGKKFIGKRKQYIDIFLLRVVVLTFWGENLRVIAFLRKNSYFLHHLVNK